MNILLINLTRFGDLIQTQAAISDLHLAGHRVGLVCLDNFAGAAKFLKHLDYIAPFNGARLLSLIQPLQNSQNLLWGSAYATLHTWRTELQQNFSYQAVCNLTSAPSSRILAKFLAGESPVLGFALDKSGYGDNSNAWASYLESTSCSRNLSPINIVDIFRRIASSPHYVNKTEKNPLPASSAKGFGKACLQKPHDSVFEAMHKLLNQQKPEASKGLVGMQLGASHEKRRWPVEYFVRAGQILWEKEKLCPVLLGSQDELALATEYAGLAKHPFISLCGNTNLEQLGAALQLLSLLITNDTGTMHFAVGFDVPILSIFLMTAQPFDTGPYQLNSCSLEADMPCHPCAFGSVCLHEYACGTAIKPELVAELALSFLTKGTWKSTQTSGARLWQTTVDHNGFASLEPLNSTNSHRHLWFNLLRAGLCQFLDSPEYLQNAAPPADLAKLFPEHIKNALQKDLNSACQCLEIFEQQGKVLAVRHVPLIKERFLNSWQRVHQSFKTSVYLGALAGIWVDATQKQGLELVNILQATADFQKLLQYFQKSLNVS